MDSNVKSLTTQYRYNRWVGIISERNASGLSIKDWCRQNNVNETSYYYWLKKIRHSIVESLDPEDQKDEVTFVPMLSQPKTNEFSHVNHDKTSSAPHPEVVIKLGEITIEFGNQTSQELILNVLRALRNV
jgi:transposase-like protein